MRRKESGREGTRVSGWVCGGVIASVNGGERKRIGRRADAECANERRRVLQVVVVVVVVGVEATSLQSRSDPPDFTSRGRDPKLRLTENKQM